MLAIAVVALTAIVVLPCAAQVKHKAAPVSDPLSSFKLAVGRFNTFFAAGPRKMIVAEPFHRSVSGRVVTIYQYSAQDISYDVEKTNSLVSPYLATIQMNTTVKSNDSCGGDVKGPNGMGGESPLGWSTVKAALAADRLECYSYGVEGPPVVWVLKLVFAFQDGKWMFSNAIFAADGTKCERFLSIFGNVDNPAVTTRFPEPEAQALNSVWRDLVRN
jgi:hypothetical protein